MISKYDIIPRCNLNCSICILFKGSFELMTFILLSLYSNSFKTSFSGESSPLPSDRQSSQFEYVWPLIDSRSSFKYFSCVLYSGITMEIFGWKSNFSLLWHSLSDLYALPFHTKAPQSFLSRMPLYSYLFSLSFLSWRHPAHFDIIQKGSQI